MKSQKKSALLVAVAVFNLATLASMHAQVRRTFTPTYTPPPSRPAQTYTPPAQHTSPPPQHQTNSQPSYSAPQRSTPSYSTPSRPAVEQNHSQSPSDSPKQSQSQQKQQAAQQQRQQKEQARQQKEVLKQQQKQQKEQARQQKQTMKQQEKQQKQKARSQKNSTKPANEPKQPSSAPKAVNNSVHAAQTHTASAYHVPEGSALGKTGSGSTKLSHEGSRSVLQQVNSARLQMSGINRKPIPAGDITLHANGRLTVNADGGRQYGIRPDGTISSYRDSTKTVSLTPGGKVRSLRTSNLEVRHSANGQRTVISRRADNTRLISTGAHSGYVERNVVVGNQTYIQRTTVINNRIVTNHYVGFAYGGIAMARLVTPVFYAPAFYGWAFYPWVAPIHFTFGWFGAPWYIGPNPYFVAYPVYPGAAFWLTDYMIGETLAEAYEMHA
ncbi:MAG: hypothetical protein WBW85_20410, partial [Terriglobales bacterium]